MGLSDKVEAILEELRVSLSTFDFSDVGSKRLAILNVFMRLAVARGYAAVTMRAIGAELKIKAPSIYSHFPGGREEITEYCLRWQSRDYAETLLAAVRTARNHDELWDTLAQNHCRQQLSNPNNSLWDMIVASDRVGKFLPPSLREEMHERLDLFIRLYAAVAEELGYSNSMEKARAVMTLLDCAVTWCDWSVDSKVQNAALAKAVAFSRGILTSDTTVRAHPSLVQSGRVESASSGG